MLPVDHSQMLAPGDRIRLPAEVVLHALHSFGIGAEPRDGLRPPLGIYNNSSALVATRLRDLVSEIGAARRSTFKSGDIVPYDVAERCDSFLDSVMEHLEACKGVLKALLHDKKGWTAHSAVRAYDAATASYRDHVGKIVNRIKHNQARVRPIAFIAKHSVDLGYYIEAAGADGVLGPDIVIHDGGATAFSFNRDMRVHVAALFAVSLALSEAILGVHGGELPATPAPTSGTCIWNKPLVTVANMDTTVFPDEAGKPWPLVLLAAPKGRRQRSLTVVFPSVVQAPRSPKPKRVAICTGGDGASRRFQLPYWEAPRTQPNQPLGVRIWRPSR